MYEREQLYYPLSDELWPNLSPRTELTLVRQSIFEARLPWPYGPCTFLKHTFEFSFFGPDHSNFAIFVPPNVTLWRLIMGNCFALTVIIYI